MTGAGNQEPPFRPLLYHGLGGSSMSTAPAFQCSLSKGFSMCGEHRTSSCVTKVLCCWHGHHHIEDCNASDTQKAQTFPGLGVRKWQSLPAGPSVNVLVCTENILHSFLPRPCDLLTPMVYNLKISLLQRETAPTESLKLPP